MSWDELSTEEKRGNDEGRSYHRHVDRQRALLGGGRFAPIDYTSAAWQYPGVGRVDSFEGGAGDHEVDGGAGFGVGEGDAGGDAGGDGGGGVGV